MARRAPATAAQLDLLGLDPARLGAVGVPEAVAARMHARWVGDRLPCAGEAQLRCSTCGLAASVHFRCAGRCEQTCEHGEKAAAALLRVIPRVPVRHWVLRLPGALCRASAIDQRLVRELSRGFLAHVFGFVRARMPGGRGASAECGAISLVHRISRGLVLDVHVHALVVDGGWVAAQRGPREFVPMADEPGVDELAALTSALRSSLVARWQRRGAGPERELWRMAIDQSAVRGPVAATAVRRIRVDGVGPGRPRRVGVGARQDGLGVHVMERIDGNARGALAALARYLVRAPVALADLRPRGDDRVVHRLSRPFADGSTHVEFSTDELARRLVALTPAGHVHRVSYHGALAPGAAAKWRARPLQLALVDASHLVRAGGKRRRDRAPWDGPECDRCGGRMRLVAIDEAIDGAALAQAGGE